MSSKQVTSTTVTADDKASTYSTSTISSLKSALRKAVVPTKSTSKPASKAKTVDRDAEIQAKAVRREATATYFSLR